MNVVVGRENSAKRDVLVRAESLDMQDRIEEIVVPEREEIEVRGGERKVIKRNMYPGYILVKAVMEDEVWTMLRGTPGVTGFVSAVGQDNERRNPIPLAEDEVERIVGLMQNDKPMVKVGFVAGDTVRIISGPFRDFMGLIEEVNEERGKVRVQVTFLGKETPVELDFLQVEAS